MAQFTGGKLYVLKKDGSDGLAYEAENSTVINVGTSIRCEIRPRNCSNLIGFHFKIVPEKFGRVEVINLSKEFPIQVDSGHGFVTLLDRKFLNSGNMINLQGQLFRWQVESIDDIKKHKSAQKPRSFAPSLHCSAMKKRITIHSYPFGRNTSQPEAPQSQLPVKPESMTPHKNNLSMTSTSSFSTPIQSNKENTPKKNISLQLNNSAMLQTSYTPKVVARTHMRVTQMLCKTMTPKTPGKLNASIASTSKDSPASVYRTPKSVLSEMNRSNLIDMQTPFAGPSKNMFLLDLMSPQNKTPSKASPRSVNRTLTSTPKTATKSSIMEFSTPKTSNRNNTLLKSAIKNTITQSAKKGNATPQSHFQKARKSIVEAAAETSSCFELESSMETTIEISDSDTRSSMGQNATIVSKSSSNAELFVEDIKQQNITKQGDPKNDLSDVYGVKRMMRTPARAPKNDLTDVEGVKKMMKTPGRGPVNDLSDVEGVAALMQTPKRSTIPQVCITRPSCSGSLSTTNLNETFESPLNRTFEIDSTESIEKTFAGIVNSIDMPADQTIVLSEVGEEEMMTAEQQFDSLSGMSTSKTLDTDKDTCERVLDWIASTKDMLAKENNMDQILSNRYSNVTPNESFVGSGDAPLNSTFSMDSDPEKQLISILQVVSDANKSFANECNLTMSPVSKLSIRNNSMEFLENYNLTPSLKNEIPKSLRSTRKRIGNALSSLQNHSLADGFSYGDQNDTLNESNAYATKTEVEKEEEEAQIMSLDDQPKREEISNNVQELETPIINMNYIEFVNNDSDNEEEEIFEVEADPPGAYLHISSVSTNIDMSSDEEDAYEMTFDESEAPSPSSKDVHDSFFDEFKAIQSDEEEDILGSGPINDDNSNDASTTNKEQDKTGNLEVEVIETEEPLFSDTEISRVDLNVSELLPQDDGEDRLNHSQLTDDLDESIVGFLMESSVPDGEVIPATQQITMQAGCNGGSSSEQTGDLSQKSENTENDSKQEMIEEFLDDSNILDTPNCSQINSDGSFVDIPATQQYEEGASDNNGSAHIPGNEDFLASIRLPGSRGNSRIVNSLTIEILDSIEDSKSQVVDSSIEVLDDTPCSSTTDQGANMLEQLMKQNMEEQAAAKLLEEEQQRLEAERIQKELDEENRIRIENERIQKELEIERERLEAEKIRKEQEIEAERLRQLAIEEENRICVENERIQREQEEKRLEEERIRKEQEEKRLEEERILKEQELQRQIEAENAARLAKEAEERRLAEEAEKARLLAIEEENRQRLEAERIQKEKEEELKRLEAERILKEQELQRKIEAEKAAKLAKEAEDRRIAEERRKAEEAEKARLLAIEEETRKRLEAERIQKEQEDERKRLEKERILKEQELQRKIAAEKAAKLAKEAEERRLAEEAEKARLLAIEEETRQRLEAERIQKELEDERKRLEAERILKEQELQRKIEAEIAAKLAKEAEERRLAEERRKAEETEKARLLAIEEENRKRLEAERIKKEQEDERKRLEAERILKEQELQRQVEAAKLAKEAEDRRLAEVAEKARLLAIEEEAEKARLLAIEEEAEKARLLAIEEENRKRLEAERIKKEQEEERKRLEAVEAARLVEEEKQRLLAEAEAKRQQEKAEKAKKAEEAQRKKVEAEEKKRRELEALEIQKKKYEEETRLRLEAEEAARLVKEEEQRKLAEIEAKRQQDLEEQRKIEAEAAAKLKEEENQRKLAEKEEKKQKLAAEKAEKAKIKTEEAQKRKLQAEEKKRLKLEALEIQKQVDEEADRLRLEAEKLEAQKLAENPPIAAESVESQSASDNVQIAEATTSESLEKNGKKRKLYTEPVLSDATPKIDPEAQTAVFRDITGSEYLKLAGNEDVKPKRGRKAIASTSSDVETPKRAKRVKEASVDPEDAGEASRPVRNRIPKVIPDMVPIATRPRRKDASPAPSTQSTKSETLAADLDDNVSAISGTSKEAAKKGKKKVRILLESDEATAEVLDDKPMEVVEKKKAGRQPRQKLNAILESEESSVTSQEEPSSIPENVQPAAKKVAKAKKEASDPIIEIKSSEEDEKPGRSRRGKRVVYTEESLKVKKRNDPGLTSPESQISESDPDSPAKPAKKVPKTKAVRKAKVDEASTSNVSVTKAPKRGRKGKEPVAPEQVVDLTAVSPEAPIRSARSTRTASVAESSTSSVVAKTAKGRGRAKKQETVEFESDTTSQDKSPEIKKARRGAKALEIVASTPVSSARPIMDESAISRVSVTESSARKGRKKAETTLENSEATPAKRGRGKAAKVEEEAPKESNLKIKLLKKSVEPGTSGEDEYTVVKQKATKRAVAASENSESDVAEAPAVKKSRSSKAVKAQPSTDEPEAAAGSSRRGTRARK